MPGEEVTKDLTLRLPPDLYEQLAEAAKDEERSLSATIRMAVREYLERRDRDREDAARLEYPNPPRRARNPRDPLPRDIPPS